MFTRRALSLLLGASMLQWSAAGAHAHCQAAARAAVQPAPQTEAHPVAHQHHAGPSAPSKPDPSQEPPDCCIALGSCAIGSFVVPSDEKGGVSAIADRIDDVIIGVPTYRHHPPDPPPPRA